MKKLGKQLKALWRDESAQGATEYILLLVAIVALVLLFRDKFTQLGNQMMGEVSGKITDALK